MTRMSKSDIEELITGYLDNRLSQRQHTEVERLMQHDNVFARKLARIEKQRQLLMAMPHVQAPDNMFEDIKYFLDRKHHTDQVTQIASTGSRHLIGRRIMTSAAMFALIGLLGAVVYNILKPIPLSTTKIVAEAPSYIHDTFAIVDVAETTQLAARYLPSAYPINAALTLRTSDVMGINSLIEKAIFNNGLLDYMVPHRQPKRSTYQLTCSSDSIIAFLSDVDIALRKSDDTELTVFGKDTFSKVVIKDVTTSEVADFYRSDPSSDHIEFAKQIASFKEIVKDLPASDLTGFALLDSQSKWAGFDVVKPVLTSGAQQDIMQQLYREENHGEVNLTVIVVDR